MEMVVLVLKLLLSDGFSNLSGNGEINVSGGGKVLGSETT